ncbi:aldehyde dehydrogenase family protein, partial [Sinorhizobium meliloti]
VFNVILSTDSAEVGKEMCANDKVRKLTFTGSTNVGKILMRQGADQIMKLGLELGGNAPFIVFDDADLDAAVEGAMVAKYRNNGQTCVCANRIFVQAGIYDAFAARLTAKVSEMTIGDGFEPDVDAGPLISEKALAKVEEHIRDAVTKGADLVLGGNARGGLFFEPTVLTGATMDMKIAGEETFGPVAPLFKFETENEVVSMANKTEFGLASYFYSKDVSKVFRVAEALEYGMVGINTGLISTEVAPFGGVKQSGQGREGSKYGIDDYVETKYLCLSI